MTFENPHTDEMRILHLLRAPVGGLFRHVCDLARWQAGNGYRVGVVCADQPNDALTLSRLGTLEKYCDLGVTRIPLGRVPGFSDVAALMSTSRKVRECAPDILHGHGAKGGLLSRLAAPGGRFVRIYTPHGGSIHYAPQSLAGKIFGTAERFMMKRTDAVIFESAFAQSTFVERFGALPTASFVVHNGVGSEDFEPVEVDEDAADFLFLGELRALKGIFVLLDAIARLSKEREVRLAVVGDGPDRDAVENRIGALGLKASVVLHGALPARDAFRLGGTLVMPSLKESLPYVVLEAAAAGKSVIATRTGGIPEIFGPLGDRLIAPGEADQLTDALRAALEATTAADGQAVALKQRVSEAFSIDRMGAGIDSVYRAALRVLGRDIGPGSHVSRTDFQMDAAE
ncbi:MAG: glycosyltransferase family 4 protein [Parvibaculaceae bacterium]